MVSFHPRDDELLPLRGTPIRRAKQVRVVAAEPTTPEESGSGGCDCDHCLAGVTIPDATECCESHLTWSLTNPWTACATSDLKLHYEPDDKWITDVFEGPANDDDVFNEYRYELTVDVDGRSYLTLVLETDNGYGDVCLVYGCDGFQCLCDNQLTIKKPWGTLSGIARSDVSCNVCLKPVTDTVDTCGLNDLPQFMRVSLSGAGSSDISGWFPASGEVLVQFTETLGCLASCLTSSMPGWKGAFTLPDIPDRVFSILVVCSGRASGPNGPGFDVYHVRCGLGLDNNTSFTQFNWNSGFDGFDPRIGGDLREDSYCVTAGGGPLDSTITITPINAATPITSTGACNDDCTVVPAPPNPGGCCCLDGELYDFWTEGFCGDMGGDWHADCPGTCAQNVSCCLPDGSCIDGLALHLCDDIGGSGTVGGLCADSCVGACCHSDGTCELTTMADCSAATDTFYGVGTDCTGRDCTGSCCCYVGGVPNCCLDAQTTESECATISLADCDAGAGTPVWIAGDDTCATCPGTC